MPAKLGAPIAPASKAEQPAAGRSPADRRATSAVQALTRASKLMELASGDLSLAHYRVMAAIAAGDERASRVAARLALGRPAVSATVDALCSRKLLERSVGTGDQRVVRLHLTKAGVQLLESTEQAMTSKLEALVARTGRPAEVLDSLVALGVAIDEAASERRR